MDTPLPPDFVTGFLIGIAVTLVIVAVCYGIPAVFWWVHDLVVALAQRPSRVDELLEDRCDLCRVVLTEDIEAITCDAHRYCGDCDDETNRCKACSLARWEAMNEELA